MPLCKCRKNKNSIERCPFQAKPGSDFCGIHNRGCPSRYPVSQDVLIEQPVLVVNKPIQVVPQLQVAPVASIPIDTHRVAFPDGQLVGARRSPPKQILQNVKKCKADEENHPVHPERCLKKCKPGQKRNMATMRCAKSNSPNRLRVAVPSVPLVPSIAVAVPSIAVAVPSVPLAVPSVPLTVPSVPVAPAVQFVKPVSPNPPHSFPSPDFPPPPPHALHV
jgi:hypothetical protein